MTTDRDGSFADRVRLFLDGSEDGRRAASEARDLLQEKDRAHLLPIEDP